VKCTYICVLLPHYVKHKKVNRAKWTLDNVYIVLRYHLEFRYLVPLKCSIGRIYMPAGDLLAAKHGASTSEILAAYSCWGAVHGSGAAYTRMALTLVDKVLSGSFKKPLPPPQPADGKRKRSESGSSSGSHRPTGSSSRHSGGDHPPVFTRGGGRGGSRGSFPAHFSKRGSSRDTHYDKLDNRHTGGGHNSGAGPGRGGGYDGRYSSGSCGGGGYNNRY